MKRTIKYRGIKSIKYILDEGDLNEAALQAIKSGDLFIFSQKRWEPAVKFGPSQYFFEWCDTDSGRTYLEITQEIIEEESNTGAI